MKFGNLNYLYLLWLVPALALFYVYAFRAKDKAILAFCSLDLADKLMPRVSRGRQKFKAAMLITAVLFMILALVRPKWGFQWEEVKRRGVDIIIALDVSQSMLAEDVKPNRLERAKREITDLLQILEGDRIGLVAFAGTAFVQCPLTLDYRAVNIFLDYLDTDSIPLQGTALGQAIRTSISAFSSRERKSKALILITDGEGHEGDAIAAAEEAKQEGIKIFCIGIGREGGAPIPLPGDSGGFKKDANGELILSELDEVTLQKIALLTGGSYVRSVTGNLDLEEIYQKGIRQRVKQKELKSTRRKRWEERFQWFVLAALMLVVGESLLSEKRRIGPE
jgi:Ca-activated chloride channel family protein